MPINRRTLLRGAAGPGAGGLLAACTGNSSTDPFIGPGDPQVAAAEARRSPGTARHANSP